MKKKTHYNIRIIDNGNGTYSLGFVHRFKTTPMKKKIAGEWVEGNVNKVIRLLNKGSIK